MMIISTLEFLRNIFLNTNVGVVKNYFQKEVLD